ncbi:MAG: class I SAM-dependent methyltransferase [Alphaproteobacteria bacterium]|nr:class I SAM-dependent methyltransferase [Alphaproteobacteria bacterium]
MQLPIDIETVKGFLDAEEGAALYQSALKAAPLGPLLEVGSYCGKSAVYVGTAARDAGSVLFTIDHHRGSEEMQPGWEHHDPSTWDVRAGSMDSLPFLRDTLRRARLEEVVVPVVGRSSTVARVWRTPLAFLFIDGGHAMAEAEADYRGWTPHVMPGGTLAIHDVFPDPKDGGRPPYEIYRMALTSGAFVETGAKKSLRLLRRV